DVLVHIHPHRVRGAGDDAEPRTPAITPDPSRGGAAMLFLLGTGWRRVHAGGLTIRHTSGAHIPTEELRQPTALRLQAPRRHQVPDVFVPGWPGCRDGLALSVRQHDVIHQTNFGGFPLRCQGSRTLVFVPQIVVAFDVRFKAVEGAHEHGVHAFLGGYLGVA